MLLFPRRSVKCYFACVNFYSMLLCGMDTQNAISRAGGKSALARLLTEHGYPCTRQAVGQWGESLPPLRVYHLREIRPWWFRKAKKAPQ